MMKVGMSARLFFLLFLGTSLLVRGDSLSLAYNYHHTGNLFQTSAPVPDNVSAFALFLTKDSGGLSVLSDIRYVLFRENSGLSFGAFHLGLEYLRASGPKSAFHFALSGSGSLFRSEWTSFNSFSLDLLGAYKTYLAPSSILKAQTRSAYWAYRYSLFDHLSQVVSLSLDKFFPSLTTLKAEAVWKYKHFLHPYVSVLPEIPAIPAIPGGPLYRQGPGFIPIIDPEGGVAGIQSASLSLTAAQGLGSRVVLSVSGLRQWTLSGGNPFTSIEEFYLVSNPSTDEFSWEGWTVAPLLKVLLPWDIEAKVGYTYAHKGFPGIEVLTAEGEPTGTPRKDTRRWFEARLEKAFPALSVFLAYSRADNRSNDPMFTWSGPLFLAGIAWNLPLGRKE